MKVDYIVNIIMKFNIYFHVLQSLCRIFESMIFFFPHELLPPRVCPFAEFNINRHMMPEEFSKIRGLAS